MARLLKPVDWERIPFPTFPVVVAGLAEGAFVCRIWPATVFFGQTPRGPSPLAEAIVLSRVADLGLAWFRDVPPSGACVITVEDTSGRELTARGVHLGLSDDSDVMSGLVEDSEGTYENLTYPLHRRVRRSGALEPCDIYDPGRLVALSELFGAADLGSTVVAEVTKSEHHIVGETLRRGLSSSLGRAEVSAPHAFETEGIHVARFSDAFVNLKRGLVLADGMLWGPSSRQALQGDPKLTLFPEFVAHDGGLAWIRGGPVRRYKSERIPVLLCNAGANNFGHWVLNSLLTGYILQDRALAGEIEFVCPRLSRFQREGLRLLGLSNAVVELDDQHVVFDRVVFPSPLSTHTNAFPPRVVVELFGTLRERARDSAKYSLPHFKNGGRFLYLTRKGFPSGRLMANEDELIAGLRGLGVDCLAPHQLGFSEEVNAFRKAKIIISPLGASLANQGFAPTGCDIVEITTNAYHSDEFLYLASLLGHQWTRFEVDVPEQDRRGLGQFTYEVPVDQLIDIVTELISRKTAI